MTLPPNYYDFIHKARPFVLNLAEQDAQDLLLNADHPTTIYSVDSYPSRHNECLNHVASLLMEDVSQRTGMSVEQLKSYSDRLPQDVKTRLRAIYETVNQEYHCIVNFALSGKKAFRFSDNLSDHFANTEINLKTGLVELPFPTCLFTFTSRSVVNAMHNINGDDGRWDMNTAGLDYSAPVSVFLTMHPAESNPEDSNLPGRKLLMVAWHARQPESCYLMLKRELYMDESWTLEQALRTDWKNVDPENCGDGISCNTVEGTSGQQNDEKFYTDGLTFFRIVLNAVLYLSSDQAERFATISPRTGIEAKAKKILSIPKRKKAMREASHYSQLDYEEVGASVGTIVVQRDTAGSDNLSDCGSGNKPLYRFMVRGHWRQQPHGLGNQKRKLTWIKPFYKGSDLATYINKPYLVK